MNAGFSRRKFIQTGGSLLLLLPLVEYCKNKSKTGDTKPGNKKRGKKVARVSKKRKQPIVAKMVTNRGWYKNKRNGKIHYFDDRGFTPSLLYLKNQKEFETFVQHLETWDAKQLTLEIFEKKISKKSKDWITEQAALAFASSGNYANAASIIGNRIIKRPANVRMWDLLAVIEMRSGNERVKAEQLELIARFSHTANPALKARLAKYVNTDWQAKFKEKGLLWDNQKI